jgi:UDP-N-acetyl-D-mannosaminuronate dehydrogenase
LERNLSRALDGARVTALGVAFKAHTSDTRDS